MIIHCSRRMMARCRQLLGRNNSPTDTVEFVSVVRERPSQMKICKIVVTSTSWERDHFISTLQFGQYGASRCSNDFLSLSNIRPRRVIRYFENQTSAWSSPRKPTSRSRISRQKSNPSRCSPATYRPTARS